MRHVYQLWILWWSEWKLNGFYATVEAAHRAWEFMDDCRLEYRIVQIMEAESNEN